MTYRIWLATFQTHEQAARSAFDQVEQLAGQLGAVKAAAAKATSDAAHWRTNHAHVVERCRYLGSRHDLPVDRIPAFTQHVEEIARLRAENFRLQAEVETLSALEGVLL